MEKIRSNFCPVLNPESGTQTDEGRLSLILPSDGLRDLRRCAASFGLHPFRLLHIKTTATKPPRRVVAEFSAAAAVVEEQCLTLSEAGEKTEEYSLLTRDFYL